MAQPSPFDEHRQPLRETLPVRLCAGAITRVVCRCYENSWLTIHDHVETKKPSYRYVVSLYFAVVTMTTTGYGDFRAHCSRGFFAVIVTVIAGMIIFAYALSVLTATLANIDAPKYSTTVVAFTVFKKTIIFTFLLSSRVIRF